MVFILFVDEILRKCQLDTKRTYIGHPNLQDIRVSEYTFPDDVVIIAESEEAVLKNPNIWNKILTGSRMETNITKTKILAVATERKI